MAHKLGADGADPGACQDLRWRSLMASMLKQALIDMVHGDLASGLDAHIWLLADGPLYLDALDIGVLRDLSIDPIVAKKVKKSLRR